MAKKTVQEGSGGSGEVVACTFDDMRLKVGVDISNRIRNIEIIANSALVGL